MAEKPNLQENLEKPQTGPITTAADQVFVPEKGFSGGLPQIRERIIVAPVTHLRGDIKNRLDLDMNNASGFGGAYFNRLVTFTSADATPSVAKANLFKTAGTTTITDFDDGEVGQVITILATASITVQNNAAILLEDGSNFDMVDGDVLMLAMFNDQVWNEIGRAYDAGNDLIGLYGDGSDGSATISGATTLTSDMYYTDLTVDSGQTLTTDGYRIFATGTVTVNGTIANNGNAGGNGGNGILRANPGTAGTAGTGANGNVLPAGTDGVVGGAGGAGADSSNNATAASGGTAGTAKSNCLGNNGAAGSNGGGGGGSCTGGIPTNNSGGGSGGAGGACTAGNTEPRNITQANMMYDLGSSLNQYTLAGGSGGGAGGGGGCGGNAGGADVGNGGSGGGGGGSGGSGGNIVIFGKTITVGASGAIRANGGAGGNGGNGGNATCGGDVADGGGGGGGGAGGGGNGGTIVLVYDSYTNNGTVEAAGGAAGTPGNAGSSCNDGGSVGAGSTGNAGAAGTIFQIPVI